MSLFTGYGGLDMGGFPRVSGDEPIRRSGWVDPGSFSPRERG